MNNYYAPTFDGNAFTCVYCGTYASQIWFELLYLAHGTWNHSSPFLKRCVCLHCKLASVWSGENMIIPSAGNAPLPHADLPEDCKDDYSEARDIVGRSPKAAAALLRLIVQKLMIHLGEDGGNINKDIKSLVSKGLPPQVQKALDICRIVGNSAVHPGLIEINDSPEIAYNLFTLVNFIVDEMITRPKRLDELYGQMPENLLDGIVARDTPRPTT